MRFLLIAVLGLLSGALPAQDSLRVWNQDGQTFLVWANPRAGVPPSYDIHRTADLHDPLTDETLIGRAWSDAGQNHRMQPLIPGARWRLPLPAGSYILEDDEVCFVHTPEPGVANYVVVPHGDRTSSPGQRTGLLRERDDPVKAHVQFSDDRITVYAHWVAGGDPQSAEATVPFNGTPHLFAVWEPRRGRGEGPMPAVVALHREGESFLDMRPQRDEPALSLDEGLLITPDDALLLDRGPGRGRHWAGTAWMGHLENLSPFEPDNPGEDDRIALTTQRRLAWEIAWCKENLPIDPDRVGIIGAGVGADGALAQAMLFPDALSAVTALAPRLEIPESDETAWVLGDERGRAVLMGARSPLPPLWMLFDPLAMLQSIDPPHLPPVNLLFGTGDPTWPRALEMMPRLERARRGMCLWWDERSLDHWRGAHWRTEPELTAEALAASLRTRPFVGVSGTDLDPETGGRQPDPAVEPWGSWGGEVASNPRALRDRETEFQAQLWSETERPIVADLTLLNCTAFQPTAEARLRWLLWRRADRRTMASGHVQVGADGSITIPQVELLPTRLNLHVDVAPPVAEALLPFRAE